MEFSVELDLCGVAFPGAVSKALKPDVTRVAVELRRLFEVQGEV